jgi:hypothetical protein
MKKFIERSSVNDAAPWRTLLHEALHDQAEPVFTTDETNIPPASIWTGSRLWATAFRERGIVSGDTIAVALAPGPVYAQVLTAALFENLTIALVTSSKATLPETVRVLITDTTLMVASEPTSTAAAMAIWNPAGIAGPGHLHGSLRVPKDGDEGRHRILTQKGSRWVGTSDSELLNLTKRVCTLGNLSGKVSNSSYPWIDRDSLVLGLLAPLAARSSQILTLSGTKAPGSVVPGHTPRQVQFPQLMSL